MRPDCISKLTVPACRPKPLPAINPIPSCSFRHHRGIFSPPPILTCAALGKKKEQNYLELLGEQSGNRLLLRLFHIQLRSNQGHLKQTNSCTFSLTLVLINPTQDSDFACDSQGSPDLSL